MKKVLNPSELAHRWANQLQPEGTTQGRNFYFEKETIFSYGSHFPIAAHYKDVVLFTLRDYSNTTAKHKNKVWAAISHRETVFCFRPDYALRNEHEENINFWLKSIDAAAQKLLKARKPEIHLSEIERQKNQLGEYLQLFGLKLNKAQTAKISFTCAEEYKTAAANAEKLRVKEENRIKKEGSKIFGHFVDFWHDGGSVSDFRESLNGKQREIFDKFRDTQKMPTLLKVNGENVESSKGIKLPFDVAKRYFQFYERIVKAGGCSGNCNFKMLDYDVREASPARLVVGCHDIPASEIYYISKKLNF